MASDGSSSDDNCSCAATARDRQSRCQVAVERCATVHHRRRGEVQRRCHSRCSTVVDGLAVDDDMVHRDDRNLKVSRDDRALDRVDCSPSVAGERLLVVDCTAAQALLVELVDRDDDSCQLDELEEVDRVDGSCLLVAVDVLAGQDDDNCRLVEVVDALAEVSDSRHSHSNPQHRIDRC